MARRTCKNWAFVPIAVMALGIGLTPLGCATSHARLAKAHDTDRVHQLQAQVQRLSLKVAALETQLQKEHRAITRERLVNQEQRERLAKLESDFSAKVSDPAREGSTATADAQVTVDPGSIATERASVTLAARMTVEAELRQAHLALMRAIERIAVSPEEKALLKNSLRPARSLDPDNPWATASRRTSRPR
jgi:TolA-binding protein